MRLTCRNPHVGSGALTRLGYGRRVERRRAPLLLSGCAPSLVVDRADPTVLKLAWSGSVELDRANASQVGFYNDLVAGKSVELVAIVHVAGSRKVHRRDSEGDVDAIVETKSLVVSDVHLERLTES